MKYIAAGVIGIAVFLVIAAVGQIWVEMDY